MTDGFKRFARYPGAYRPTRGSMFRIYRDVRFSKEMCPNKDMPPAISAARSATTCVHRAPTSSA